MNTEKLLESLINDLKSMSREELKTELDKYGIEYEEIEESDNNE